MAHRNSTETVGPAAARPVVVLDLDLLRVVADLDDGTDPTVNRLVAAIEDDPVALRNRVAEATVGVLLRASGYESVHAAGEAIADAVLAVLPRY